MELVLDHARSSALVSPMAVKKRVNSRAKGAAAERELANILKSHGYDARRGQQFSGGGDSPDVMGLPGFHIEAKRTEVTDMYGWLAQAQRDAHYENYPLVLHRKNGHKWVAIMDFEDFLRIVKTFQERTNDDPKH